MQVRRERIDTPVILVIRKLLFISVVATTHMYEREVQFVTRKSINVDSPGKYSIFYTQLESHLMPVKKVKQLENPEKNT